MAGGKEFIQVKKKKPTHLEVGIYLYLQLTKDYFCLITAFIAIAISWGTFT